MCCLYDEQKQRSSDADGGSSLLVLVVPGRRGPLHTLCLATSLVYLCGQVGATPAQPRPLKEPPLEQVSTRLAPVEVLVAQGAQPVAELLPRLPQPRLLPRRRLGVLAFVLEPAAAPRLA